MTRVISKRPRQKPMTNKTRMQRVKVISEIPTLSRVFIITAQAGGCHRGQRGDSDVSQDMLTGKGGGSSDGRTKSETVPAEADQEKRGADNKGENDP